MRNVPNLWTKTEQRESPPKKKGERMIRTGNEKWHVYLVHDLISCSEYGNKMQSRIKILRKMV